MQPLIIFCPFSRRWGVDQWLENLAGVDHDPTLTSLCFIIDGDEPYIRNVLTKFAKERNYRKLVIKENYDYRPNEVNLSVRRQRVADLHEQAKDLVAQCDGDIVIGLEDDTVFDRMPDFGRLIFPLVDGTVGFVEGVQMGRHGARMIGAWRADDVFDPTHIETLLPPEEKSCEEITGGGWYGYSTRKDLFLNAPYFASPSYPWGPDVNFGFWLRQRGFRCIVDWSLIFGHRDHNETMYPDDPRARLTKVVYNKSSANGKWNRIDYEQNN